LSRPGRSAARGPPRRVRGALVSQPPLRRGGRIARHLGEPRHPPLPGRLPPIARDFPGRVAVRLTRAAYNAFRPVPVEPPQATSGGTPVSEISQQGTPTQPSDLTATGPRHGDAQRLAALLEEWVLLREQGKEVSVTELCRDCPHLTAALAEEI